VYREPLVKLPSIRKYLEPECPGHIAYCGTNLGHVGARVGAAVGACVGVVGAAVGAAVGTVGTAVGAAVGAAVAPGAGVGAGESSRASVYTAIAASSVVIAGVGRDLDMAARAGNSTAFAEAIFWTWATRAPSVAAWTIAPSRSIAWAALPEADVTAKLTSAVPAAAGTDNRLPWSASSERLNRL
jgi:hypothetical protein